MPSKEKLPREIMRLFAQLTQEKRQKLMSDLQANVRREGFILIEGTGQRSEEIQILRAVGANPSGIVRRDLERELVAIRRDKNKPIKKLGLAFATAAMLSYCVPHVPSLERISATISKRTQLEIKKVVPRPFRTRVV
jgi:hypothetical protein